MLEAGKVEYNLLSGQECEFNPFPEDPSWLVVQARGGINQEIPHRRHDILQRMQEATQEIEGFVVPQVKKTETGIVLVKRASGTPLEATQHLDQWAAEFYAISTSTKITSLANYLRGILALQNNGLYIIDHKPDSVFIQSDGTVEVVDPGYAYRNVDDEERDLRQLFNAPSYAAMERSPLEVLQDHPIVNFFRNEQGGDALIPEEIKQYILGVNQYSQEDVVGLINLIDSLTPNKLEQSEVYRQLLQRTIMQRTSPDSQGTPLTTTPEQSNPKETEAELVKLLLQEAESIQAEIKPGETTAGVSDWHNDYLRHVDQFLNEAIANVERDKLNQNAIADLIQAIQRKYEVVLEEIQVANLSSKFQLSILTIQSFLEDGVSFADALVMEAPTIGPHLAKISALKDIINITGNPEQRVLELEILKEDFPQPSPFSRLNTVSTKDKLMKLLARLGKIKTTSGKTVKNGRSLFATCSQLWPKVAELSQLSNEELSQTLAKKGITSNHGIRDAVIRTIRNQ